jgi:O-succinylbenzoate synthase
MGVMDADSMRFRLQFRRYRLPFRSVVRTAHGPWAEREGVIVRLKDASEGGTDAVGFGEAAPIPWFGTETVDEVEAECRRLGEWIDESALESVPKNLGCTRNALAAAQRDLRTKVESAVAPMVSSVGVAALLPAGRAALAQVEPKAEIGFRVFKWKVGVGDLADELALLDDVCAALPNGAKLRLDANGAWDRRKAERWLERCADRPVEFVEQPCFAAASQGAALQRRMDDVLLGLAGDYPTPLALDESLVGETDLEKWIGAGWPGVYVVKPSLFGDVTAAMGQLEKAKASVVFSSALETAVGAKAALSVALAWREPTATASVANDGSKENGTADRKINTPPRRALGFGVWPLFADPRFDGPAAAAFLRSGDVARIDAEKLWNALS